MIDVFDGQEFSKTRIVLVTKILQLTFENCDVLNNDRIMTMHKCDVFNALLYVPLLFLLVLD